MGKMKISSRKEILNSNMGKMKISSRKENLNNSNRKVTKTRNRMEKLIRIKVSLVKRIKWMQILKWTVKKNRHWSNGCAAFQTIRVDYCVENSGHNMKSA